MFTPAKRTPEDDERDKEDAAQDIRDAITQMATSAIKNKSCLNLISFIFNIKNA